MFHQFSLFSKCPLTFVLIIFLLVLAETGFSQYPYNYDVSPQPRANEVKAVFPFEVAGKWAGCGYSQPRSLRIVDSVYSQNPPFAVFQGGKKMGGAYIAEFGGGTCGGLNGYSTYKYFDRDSSSYPTQMSDTLTVTFASPVPAKSLVI